MTTQTTFAPGCLYKVTNKDHQLLFLVQAPAPPLYTAFGGGNSALVMALDSLLREFPVPILAYKTPCLKCLWNDKVVNLYVDSNVEFAPIDETD